MQKETLVHSRDSHGAASVRQNLPKLENAMLASVAQCGETHNGCCYMACSVLCDSILLDGTSASAELILQIRPLNWRLNVAVNKVARRTQSSHASLRVVLPSTTM